MTDPRGPMRSWIASIIISHHIPLVLILVLQLSCGVLASLQPLYYQQLVSLVAGGPYADLRTPGIALLAQLGGIYVAIAVLQGVSGFTGSSFSYKLLKQLQTNFFEQTSHLPLHYFQRQSAGEFFTRFNNDIGQAQRFFADLLPRAIRELITAIVVTVILFLTCPAVLVISALGIVGLTTVLVTILNRIMGRYARAQRAGWSEVHRVFDETVQGIDTIKTQGAEGMQSRHFEIQTAALRKTSVKAGAVLSVFSPGIELISRLGGLIPLAMAYFLITNGAMRLEAFLLFFFYATLLQMSVSQLTTLFGTAQTEFTGLRHLAAFFSESPEMDEGHTDSTMPEGPATIELSGVTFQYPGGRRIYNRTNMLIPARSVTVIRGDSGSGKSTLINLLLRFYPVEQGLITIGGVDIRRIPPGELRKRIGVVTQQHFIFQESLRANLLIAKPDATDPEILHAIERAQLGEFLGRLPQGIDTIMDPRGKGLSAGERQRICIARLLLRGSPIMILDEPWSNLDFKSRIALADVMNNCRAGATVLVLSHERLPALAVDRLYCLDGAKGVFIQESLIENDGRAERESGCKL